MKNSYKSLHLRSERQRSKEFISPQQYFFVCFITCSIVQQKLLVQSILEPVLDVRPVTIVKWCTELYIIIITSRSVKWNTFLKYQPSFAKYYLLQRTVHKQKDFVTRVSSLQLHHSSPCP